MRDLPEDTAPLPAPSPELVLFRVHVEASIAVMGRKKAERYLRVMAETISAEESLAEVLQIRQTGQQARVRAAHREAAALFRRYLPLFIARSQGD